MRNSASVHALLFCALGTLCACGGGGGSSAPQLPPSVAESAPPSATSPTPPPNGPVPTPGASVTMKPPGATSTPVPLKTATPVPVKTATPVPTQTLPPSSRALTLLQVFDAGMTAAQATSTASQVSWVWGAGSGSVGATARAWLTGNPHVIPIMYFYQGTDDPNIDPNTIGGSHLAYFQTVHPDWIVYDCNAQNQPTRTIAYQSSTPTAVPLDISNPAVVDYQVRLAAQTAINRGDLAIGADQTIFFIFDGNKATGEYGCGVYTGPNFTGFVRKWTAGFDRTDANWATDTANWVKTAKLLLTTDKTLAPHHLRLVVNHPTGNASDPNEQTLVKYADANLDESGFGDYGNYIHEPGLLSRTLQYMTFWQSHATFLVIDKFGGSGSTESVSKPDLSWAVASFLLGNVGHAAFFVTDGSYGYPSYFPEYTTVDSRIGTACSAYTVDGSLISRKFSGGYVVANDSTSAAFASLPLPASKYVDMEGNVLTNPLRVGGTSAYVLFSSTRGC